MVAPDLSVDLAGIWLRTPLMPAAGTLDRDSLSEMRDVYGAILPKTATSAARRGNPPPRVAETPAGMVNSIGLQNPGIDEFLRGLDDYDVELPIVVSIAADTVGEFAHLCGKLNSDGRVAAVELNLSCPNVEHGGATFCASPANVAAVVRDCRKQFSGRPLFAKLTSEGAVGNALAAESEGAEAITVINTVPALTIDPLERRILVRGGLSGPAMKPIALRAVYDVSRAVEVPVIGCGGVVRGTDVAEHMLAGASVVQVGSGSFVRGPREILDEFSEYLQNLGMNAAELTGNLRDIPDFVTGSGGR